MQGTTLGYELYTLANGTTGGSSINVSAGDVIDAAYLVEDSTLIVDVQNQTTGELVQATATAPGDTHVTSGMFPIHGSGETLLAPPVTVPASQALDANMQATGSP